MTIKDRYGLEYEDIANFVPKTINDFKADVVLDLINSYDEDLEDEDAYGMVDFLYPENENGGNRDADGKYIPYYNKDAGPIGYRITPAEEFSYEGGFIQGLGTFTVLDSGNLGDGHDAWTLFKHEESGRLFRVGGWYSSWDSGEWNECVEVEPAEVHVVRYKPLGAPDSKVYENPAVNV